ncbi:MAG TPA: exodeoxyribonuclease V subunit gamma, partial [Fodinibius sp.]|nr:exodeoxyribonuclease V subunit gamma [Fodinibius sp.]
MLTFYYGTNQQKLADCLLATCRRAPGGNPMAPETLVVRNHGIGQWLSFYIAEKEGIAANMEFEFPSERIWKLIRSMDPDIPDTLPSNREPMTWSLMKLLQDREVIGQFDNLRHYIREDEPDRRSMRIWKLASKIADVFDQYLVYRPELILDWEEGKLQTGNTAEQWQSRLWNQLIDYWKNYHNHKWLHRARLQRQLWNTMDERRLNTDGLPVRVSMFGVSGVSPAFVKTMIKLSKLTDVYFYQVTLDPQIKKRGDFQNPLLQSLGSESAHFMDLFSSFVKADRNVASTMEWESVEPVHPGDTSILHIIQSDLLQDSPPGDCRPWAPGGDSSIQVHSCHSPMREVEVLYDQLLAMLNEHPDINPDEILVMTPDIETYAPIIEAVFDSPDAGQPEIPYSVADRGVVGRNPAIEAFLDILSLCESRLKVTDVMDLLDSNPVREAFAFSDDHVNRLNRWIRDNRIRWGVDGRFKQKVNVPESDRFTWQSGLDRVLLGYAMKPEDDRLFHHIFPYDEIETSEDAELGGKFARFLQSLFEISRSVDDVKPPGGWVSVLNRIPGMFLPGTKDYFVEISRIRDVISRLAEHASQGGFHTPIPFSIVRSWLRDRLDEQTTGGGRIGRGVTFSSLMPMRNIPFRVIGMIGMNEGVFPRSKMPIEFDLMHLEAQPGDPVRSDEDRHLFLENLLSARSHLYVSYVGQSNRQDSSFPPSVVLQEFLDYLEVYYGLKSGQIVTRHRLQAFSPHYFENGSELFSYSETKQKISQRLLEEDRSPPAFVHERLPEPGDEWKSLSVRELVAFFQHPARYLLQNRLGIYPAEEDVLTSDREPFVLSRLDSYQVGQ